MIAKPLTVTWAADWTCEYCRSRWHAGEYKCQSCGAHGMITIALHDNTDYVSMQWEETRQTILILLIVTIAFIVGLGIGQATTLHDCEVFHKPKAYPLFVSDKNEIFSVNR